MRKQLASKRAVSGAITAVFLTLIFFAAMATLLAYHVNQDRYNQLVNERRQMDWERLNEKIIIASAERLDDGTLNASIQNVGSVTAHLVALWLSAYDGDDPLWQRQYRINIWISPGGISYNFGQDGYIYILIQPAQAGEVLNVIELPDSNWIYTIKIVTERGNVAIYQLTPPPTPTMVGGGGGYPIIIVPDYDNFEYMDTKYADKDFKSAYIKPVSMKDWHPLYRVLLNNTSGRRIILYNNSTMLQISTAGGQTTIRYIVSDRTDIHDSKPTPFVSQTINPGEAQYVYFAGSAIENPDWVGDPTKGYYTVNFMIWFRYEGESEVRSVPLPPLIQELT